MPEAQANTVPREETDVLGERIGAQIIDLIISFTVIFGISLVSMLAGFSVALAGGGSTASQGLMTGMMSLGAIISFFVIFSYNFLLEAFWGGQTLGKKALGIKVVQKDGSEVTKLGAFIRNLPGFLASIWIIWLTHLVGLITIAASDERQRLFDMAANTVVIKE